VFVDVKGRGGKGAPVSAAYRCPPYLLRLRCLLMQSTTRC
jgi:hypothetical protein